MKRISIVLALVAVIALAGTASAGPALTIRGEAKITLTGSTDDLTPVFGNPFFSLGFNSGFDITGDKWTLGGDLYPSGTSFAVNTWKLTVKPGVFTFSFANGGNDTRADLGDLSDYMGFKTISGYASGNHMRVTAPLTGLTLAYDETADQEALYVQVPKGTVPFGFIGIYDLKGRLVTGGIHYDFADSFWAEVGAVTKLGIAQGTGIGAELQYPVSSSLTAYAVAKQYGTGYGAKIKNNSGVEVPYTLVTLGQLTYTQPNYRVFGQVKPYYDSTGTLVHREDLVSLGVVQNKDNSKTWYKDASDAYRSLKGWALYGEYDIDNPALLLAAGAPVVPDKAWLKVWTPNALAKDSTDQTKGAVVSQGQLYVKLTDKLTSVTDVTYKQGVGLTQLDDTLTYSVSGSSSIELKLSKPQAANRVDYTATFKVTY